MTELEIVLKSIDLLNAIKKNDINQTKEIVQYLNENFEPTENIFNFNELIPLYEIFANINSITESYAYVLNNLQHIHNVDKIKWIVSVRELVIKNNHTEIESFISNILNSGIILDYQLPHLIQLSVTIDRYDLLNQIRELIKKEE